MDERTVYQITGEEILTNIFGHSYDPKDAKTELEEMFTQLCQELASVHNKPYRVSEKVQHTKVNMVDISTGHHNLLCGLMLNEQFVALEKAIKANNLNLN